MRLAVGFPRQVSVVVASIAFATARNVASSRLSLKIVNLLKALERNCMHDSFEQDCQDGVLVISMSYAHESFNVVVVRKRKRTAYAIRQPEVLDCATQVDMGACACG